MVRILKREPQLDDIHYVKIACLSTDDKPIGFATGSKCREVDTGDVYYYDEEGAAGSEWVKAPSPSNSSAASDDT